MEGTIERVARQVLMITLVTSMFLFLFCMLATCAGYGR